MLPDNLTIINYHKIEPQRDIGLTTRHPDDFERDLDTINDEGYHTITFHDLDSPYTLPAKPLIITFDDAYHSFYERALKLLQAKKMRAVVFVPVNYIGQNNNWDVQFFRKTYRHMTRQEIYDSAKEGTEIGSHGLSHTFLNHMKEEKIKYELRKSKQILEEIIDGKVISLSYPFGRVNKRVLALAKNYYNYGVRQLHRVNFKVEFESMCLSRINIYRHDSRSTFHKKLYYHTFPLTKIKSRMIQTGAWATVIMQKIKKRGNNEQQT